MVYNLKGGKQQFGLTGTVARSWYWFNPNSSR